MKIKTVLTATLAIVLLSITSTAQTPNQIPKWAESLVDSMITEFNGNIGIGTNAPTHPLVVAKAAGGNGTSSVISFDVTGTHSTNSTYSFQVRSSKGIAQFGIDTFFDPTGVGFMSTTASGGMIFSANNNDPHFRIVPNGDIFIQGGSTDPTAPNHRTATITIKALGNTPQGRILESQNTLTITNNAYFDPTTSTWNRDDESFNTTMAELGQDGFSWWYFPSGINPINPGGVDAIALGTPYVRLNSNFTVMNADVGIGTSTPKAKLEVSTGDVYVSGQGKGIILKATDGPNCYRVTINNSGTLATALVTCP